MPGWELIGEEEKQAVCEVFDKGGVLYRYGLDNLRQNIFRVNDFEKEISKKVGSKHALFVSSGTAALKLGLIALGVKPGDEVITQSFTFIATVEAILELGAKPIITEIDETLNMDPFDLGEKITNKTKVIIPVHMGGVSCKMDEIIKISKKHQIPILEDSCQALGSTYKGKYLGTLGEVGTYSLDIGKVITTGEGGVLVTDDEKIYKTALEYSDHGHECNPSLPRGKDTRKKWGFNYKVNELQGAVGLAQLKKLDFILNKQKNNKKELKEKLGEIQNMKFRENPDSKGDASDTLIFFLENKEKALKFAELYQKEGYGTKNLPDAIAWHFAGTWDHIFNKENGYGSEEILNKFEKSNNILRKSIAIPIMVNMTMEDINNIKDAIKKVMEKINY